MTIEVHQSVRDALYEAFTKRSADKALNDYLELLDRLIHESISNDFISPGFGQYLIPLKELCHKGTRLTDRSGNRHRIHTWLKDNCPIIQVMHMGNSIQQVNSTISLINCTYTDLLDMNYTKEFNAETDDLLDMQKYEAIFLREYPDAEDMVNGLITREEWRSRYHVSPINKKTLQGCWDWLVTAANRIDPDQRIRMIRQCRTILAIGEFSNWKLYQRIKPSPFGRTYYSGISIQSVSKVVRKNVLGDTWQYDISSSAIAWKYSFADEYCRVHGPRKFQYTDHYLTDKKDFIYDCIKNVFLTRTYTNKKGERVPYDKEWSLVKMKAMMTAISFGAKTTNVLVTNKADPTGEPMRLSLAKILTDNDLRDAFLNHDLIAGFIKEQDLLVDFILEQNKSYLAQQTCVKTPKGRRSKSKEISFLYQHAETAIMDRVREMAKGYNYKIYANVHDAIIIDRRMHIDDLHTIIDTIKQEFHMPYWNLVGEEIKAFKFPMDEALQLELDREEAIHLLLIGMQERELASGSTRVISESDISASDIDDIANHLRLQRGKHVWDPKKVKVGYDEYIEEASEDVFYDDED